MASYRGVGLLSLTVSAALALAAGCTSAEAPEGSSDADPAAIPELRSALSSLVDEPSGPPGAIVLVENGSERRVFVAGSADVDSDAAPSPDLHMRIASTSKAYSGAVALALVDDGTLALDDTIGEHLSWAPTAWSRVTLGQALHHTSGLPNFTVSPAFQEHLAQNVDQPLKPRQLLEFVADEPPEFEPGSEYRYSNTDNVVSALMAQAAAGRSYEQLLAEEVFEPLGLEGTSLPRGLRLPRPYLHGYEVDDRTPSDVSEVFAAGYVWASGGMVSTPDDQNEFVRAYIGARLFDREVQREQFDWRPGGRSDPPGPGANAAGLAVFRYRTGCGTVYGHTGNIPGYTQFFGASADGSRSAVVSINRATTPENGAEVFPQVREVFRLAVCAALSG